MDLMMIGAFAERARLSPKALRLYDRLGLLQPMRIDPVSGYRFYSEDQVADARLIALLRRLGMPLPVVADIAAKPPGEAAQAVGNYDEVFIRLAMKDMGWPALAPAVDALEAWMRETAARTGRSAAPGPDR
jgi:DNA-binding transcriptional MerR regulator